MAAFQGKMHGRKSALDLFKVSCEFGSLMEARQQGFTVFKNAKWGNMMHITG